MLIDIIFVSSLKDLFIKDNLYKDKSTELWLVIYLWEVSHLGF